MSTTAAVAILAGVAYLTWRLLRDSATVGLPNDDMLSIECMARIRSPNDELRRAIVKDETHFAVHQTQARANVLAFVPHEAYKKAVGEAR